MASEPLLWFERDSGSTAAENWSGPIILNAEFGRDYKGLAVYHDLHERLLTFPKAFLNPRKPWLLVYNQELEQFRPEVSERLEERFGFMESGHSPAEQHNPSGQLLAVIYNLEFLSNDDRGLFMGILENLADKYEA